MTVAALIARNQGIELAYYFAFALDNQASEVLTHLAFYAGWPNTMSAVPVVKGVFDSRPRATG